jgi:hypothetical protein
MFALLLLVVQAPIEKPEDATPLMSAEWQQRVKNISDAFKIDYEESASFFRALGRVSISYEDVQNSYQDHPLEAARDKKLIEMLTFGARHKLCESCYLAEKALIERHNGTLKASSYTKTQKKNIQTLLKMFQGTTIFKDLPYEVNADDVIFSLF